MIDNQSPSLVGECKVAGNPNMLPVMTEAPPEDASWIQQIGMVWADSGLEIQEACSQRLLALLGWSNSPIFSDVVEYFADQVVSLRQSTIMHISCIDDFFSSFNTLHVWCQHRRRIFVFSMLSKNLCYEVIIFIRQHLFNYNPARLPCANTFHLHGNVKETLIQWLAKSAS